MPHRVQLKLYQHGAGNRHTLNEEANFGSPRASRNNYNDHILVPNGNSGGVYELRKSCHARKRTFEERSTAKRKRGLDKLRPRKKGKKNGAKSFILIDWVGRVHTNWETIVILGTWFIRGRAEGCEDNMAHTRQWSGVVASK